MKPNLIILQPSSTSHDSMIEQICESFCQSHYVYLIRPHSPSREDSSGGVRFLNHSLDHLPGFGSVETVIAVGNDELEDQLRDCYPGSKLATWSPAGPDELAALIHSVTSPTVIHGDFGESPDRNFATAI